LFEEFTSYRQFVTTTWSKPPAILQRKLTAATEYKEALNEDSEDWEFVVQEITELRACQLSFNLQHVAIGLQGEALEIYLEDDLKEELGDVLYYLTQASNFLDVTTYDILHVITPGLAVSILQPNDLIKPVLQNIETLCNLLKKVYIYNQPLDKHIVGIKHHILNTYALIGCAHPFQEIMSENRTKLEKRYSSGFTTQASIERADKCVD